MSASDYPISFPYGATTAPYSDTHPHRGDDRACPTGTPVIINGITIGLTGSTGLSTGPHLHIQEWSGGYASTRKPQNAFRGGAVVNVDPNGTQGDGSFGKFITIQTADGWNDSYCHLSSINVTVGQVLRGEPMFNEGDRVNLNVYFYGKDMGRFHGAVGREWKDAMYFGIFETAEYKTDALLNTGDMSEINAAFGGDASSQVGKTWKNFWHEYAKPKVNAGYELVTEQLFRKK